MRKLFSKLTMIVFLLGMSTNAAWANMDGMVPHYVAELTAKVSSTGGGKVYVSKDQNMPNEEDYAQTSSQYDGRPMYMPGVAMSQVPFVAWQTASDGYYFVGWSYSDNGFDLGKFNHEYPQTEEYGAYAALYDVSSEKSKFKVEEDGDDDESNDQPKLDENGEVQFTEFNPAKYTLYATFEPVRVAGYSLSGNNTNTESNGRWESTQTVTYTFSGDNIDGDDFKSIAFEPAADGWTVNDDFVVDGNAKTGTVTVRFSTTDKTKKEYSANLRLTTKAGVTKNITLNARTSLATEEKELALYDGKNYKEDIDWSELGTKIATCTKPLIKLNANRTTALALSSNLSIDLAGHSIPGLTVAEGANVTLVNSPYGGSITGDVTNNGTLTLMGNTIGGTLVNNGTLYQNGTTIQGAATNNGTLTTTDGEFQAGLTSTKSLTANGGTFSGAVAINVTGGTASIKRGTISGTQYGVLTNGGSATIEKLAVISGGTKALNCTAGTLTVNCGKFTAPDNLASGTIIFKSAYFLNETGAVDNEVRGKKLWRNTSGAEFRANYKFFAGDYSEAKKAGVSVCHIGGTSYSSLEDALAYANNTTDKAIIIMDNDYNLPAGYYTLPANAVLIVPKNNDQGNETKTVERVTMADDDNSNWQDPERFRTLTLLAGVNLDVFGTIEVGGSQFSTNAAYTSAVYGQYGCIQMNEGSKMILQNGSELRAWGYITGDVEHKAADGSVPTGEIDARRGAMVREQFQMGDWKGAVFSGLGLLGGGGAPEVFPLTTYFIQNIEAPVKYHPGAKLSTTASVAASKNEHPTLGNIMTNILHMDCFTMSANDIQIIGETGDVAMFLMDKAADAENTWVRKWYDASKDQQVYEINSGAHIGNLVIPLVSSPMFKNADPRFPDQLNMNSGQYDLPITNNFKLHLLSGTMDFTQSTELLPGSEVEIDKESRVFITHTDGVKSGALYVYDADDWGTYAGGVKARRVKYSPAFKGEPDKRNLENLEDATILVHGSFEIYEDGYVYTSEGGANIISTNEDAGTFVFFGQNTIETKEVKQVTTATGGNPEPKTFYPAKLRNKDNTFKETSGRYANQTMLYMDDKWLGDEQMLIYLDCFTAEANMVKYMQALNGQGAFEDAVEKIYIKPQEYVEIAYNSLTVDAQNMSVEVTGNDDHTYSDADGAGRLFILLTDGEGSCQWWEVEKKDNLYHCIHPNNDTYYYWDDSNAKPEKHHWAEKTFTITWKDKNWAKDETKDTILQTYTVPYGTQAEWLSTNPTRPASVDYTYNFAGWTPALDKVTSDVTYTATYEAKQIKYTIVFVEDGGMEIERHLLARNEWPVCENLPTRTGNTLDWTPQIAAVTGNATYTATWSQIEPDKYEIMFLDYDGTTELQKGDVAVGSTPEYTKSTPTGKPANSEYTYVFDHWSPAIEEVSASSAKIYTAVYRQVSKTYTISYYDETGENKIGKQILSYGATPTPPTVEKSIPEPGKTYSYVWRNKADVDAASAKPRAIETVTGNADYVPVFSSEPINYSVLVKSNPSGACTIAGVGTYHYNEEATITLTVNGGYTFTGWSDGYDDDDNPETTPPTSRTITVTEDKELVANFTYEGAGVSINWKNEAGTQDLVAPVNQKVGTATTYLGEIPTKDATAEFTYTFYGWSTSVNGGGTLYKNGMTPKAAEGGATYYAYFTATRNQYTVTLLNAIAGACEFRGAGVREYGTTVNIVATPNGDYEFVKWQETGNTNADFNLEVTGDITLTAVVKEKEKELPEDLDLGIDATQTVATATDYMNVTITSDGVEYSSEIINADNITLYGNADFVLKKSMKKMHWYDVAVPWRVDATNGIFLVNSTTPAVLGTDIELFYYNGATRAKEGKVDACWVPVKNQSKKVLEPGRAYLFLIYKTNVSSVTFRKKVQEPLLTLNTSVQQYNSLTGDDQDGGWNGIANPALFKAYLNAGTSTAQMINAAGDGYEPFTITSEILVVGQPVYVQVAAPKSPVVANSTAYAPAPARRMTANDRPTRYEVIISAAGANTHDDRLIVQIDDSKEEDAYVIGKDLAKFGTGSTVAQMWVNRYDAKLCMNTVAPQGDATSFPMSIYAPKTGDYTIEIESAAEADGYALYLTYNGEAVWNLSDGAYTANITKGTDARYGLRVSARSPQVTTGVDEAIVDGKDKVATKVLINNQVYIIRGDKVYSIDGQLVK